MGGINKLTVVCMTFKDLNRQMNVVLYSFNSQNKVFVKRQNMGDIKTIPCLSNMRVTLNPKAILPPFFPLNVSEKGKIPFSKTRSVSKLWESVLKLKQRIKI